MFLVSVYDCDNNRILITENVVIETELSDEFMDVSFSGKNGSVVSATPLKVKSLPKFEN